MTRSYENLTLCVPRGGPKRLSEGVIVENTISSPIPQNHVLIQVDKFGWSANNVTYGMLGEDTHFRYFEFHRAPETSTTSAKTHGVIPVWGFGTVVDSTVGQIKVGERIFGYLPFARYMLIEVDTKDINTHNFYAKRPHLPIDRRPYNQITRCNTDPLYSKETEEAAMLYRPLFWTSFWCEDWLHSISYRGANKIIISSASSKTGFCLALVIRRRMEETGEKREIIGLTSASNVEFVKSLGLYDRVVLYDNVAEIGPQDGTYCYVDVAGNQNLNGRLMKHLKSSMALGVSLGMSHMSETKGSIKSTADGHSKLEMFFMPEWMHVVRKRTPVTEIAKMQKKGWSWIMRDGSRWVKMKRSSGRDAVLPKYKDTLKGSIPADTGLVFSLWDNGVLATERAKL
ncbi:hypothetical protein FRC02_000603 [Tulasnella sp. 418]|nr:hypothetical protein FRC02_000603 [Tulasnella sp. 418]